MNNRFPYFLFIFISMCISSYAAPKGEEIRLEALQTIDFLKNTLEYHYAPKAWKEENFGWDLNAEAKIAKEKILQLNPVHLKTVQRIIRDFLHSSKDYHVGIYFYSTESASLPFMIKKAEEKWFISWIDTQKLCRQTFNINVGDELVSFDGQPIQICIDQLKKEEVIPNRFLTDDSMAGIYLTSRVGFKGHIIPKGPVTVTIRSRDTNALYSYQLIWDYAKEKIPPPLKLAKSLNTCHFNSQKSCNSGKVNLPKRLFYIPMTTDPSFNTSFHSSEAKRSFIPSLGMKWWESNEEQSFHAYLFETSTGHRIGYIRIPHYGGSYKEISEFRQMIQLFEERTSALIIDQLNNPGGNLFYLYSLLSMLTDETLSTPRGKMSITQQEVNTALIIKTIFGWIDSNDEAKEAFGDFFYAFPMSYQLCKFFLDYAQFILDEWSFGKTITDPYFVFGVDAINPHPSVRYTKPILVLTNEMDFSGGDFFPTILQDNHRAVIMGTPTAGAGGYVYESQFPNSLGIIYWRYTASIAERADFRYIENCGVEPDILYLHTENDLKWGYQDYVNKILETIEEMIDMDQFFTEQPEEDLLQTNAE